MVWWNIVILTGYFRLFTGYLQKKGLGKNMDNKNFKIAISGDISIDLLLWRTQYQSNPGLFWQRYPHVHISSKPGQALLLSRLAALSTGAEILSPQIPDVECDLTEDVLQSTSELSLFPFTDDEKDSRKVYRVSQFLGFTGPATGTPKLFPVINDDEDVDMVILDDEDNGFNMHEEFWPLALKYAKKPPLIIYKTNNPSNSSNLWKHLEESHLQNTIIVIKGDDLRSKGVNISKGLSWERTALDFVWQINNNPDLAFLAKCRHLIIPFGLEGAIYYRKEKKAESYLYFMTYEFEGGFIKENQGKMYGITSCFVAGLTRTIAAGMVNHEELNKSISEGIREGIVAAQKYFIHGFGEQVEEDTFPNPAILVEEKNDFICKEHIQDVRIRNSGNPNCQACWYIIKDKSASDLAEIAFDIVKNGEKSALRFIPIAQFGKLKTVDKAEIEGYRSIKNLMGEYVGANNTLRPLSIAVFGTPGSGKSFGITEVASSIAPKLIVKLDYNLSQLQSLADLISAFHRVRDISLEGKVPLVFFDEFDTAHDGKWGWLRHFLAPMQDGLFREGDSFHPIGKAIFVFAGGTSSTFAEFCGENIQDEAEHKQFLKLFQNAKGPDFVSRLRGYVNILGPNQTDERWDQLFIIRRAMLLRSMLKRKTPHLINDRGEAQIDNGVLRAMLKVPRYKHETRSMEAILEMSMLSNAKKWEQSDLPSKQQLKLHVDEEQFSRDLMHDAFFSEKIEILAIELYHKQVFSEDTSEFKGNDDKPWEDLGEELKASLRDQVKNIPNALRKINYDVISVKERPEPIEFTQKELNIIAAFEHKRWSFHMRKTGWKYGDVKEAWSKTHPLLRPWESLPGDTQDSIIENVKTWPDVLANSSFKIERLKFLCYCEAQMLDAE